MTEFEQQVEEALRAQLRPAENVDARKAGASADWYTVHGGDVQRIASLVAAAINAACENYITFGGSDGCDTSSDEAQVAALDALRAGAAAPSENPTEQFERIANEFYRDTGFLAPGKSLPMEMCSESYYRERDAAWMTWNAARRSRP